MVKAEGGPGEIVITAPSVSRGRLIGAARLGLTAEEVEVEVLVRDGERVRMAVRPLLLDERGIEKIIENTGDATGIEIPDHPDPIDELEREGRAFEGRLLDETLEEIERLVEESDDLDTEMISSIKALSLGLSPDFDGLSPDEAGLFREAAPTRIGIRVDNERKMAQVTITPRDSDGAILSLDDARRRIEEAGLVIEDEAELSRSLSRANMGGRGKEVFTLPFAPGRAEVVLSPDAMEARLIIHPPPSHGAPAGEAEIRAALDEARIQVPVIEEAMRKAISDAKEGRASPGDGYIIASGRPPEDGTDGRIEFAVDINADPAIVDEGDLIARIIPPEKGTDGIDCLGRPIRARPGKTARLSPGGFVSKDHKTGEFRVRSGGRVVLTGEVISIEPYEPGRVEVIVSDDALEAFADISPPKGEAGEVSFEDVKAKIDAAGVTFGVDESAIVILLNEVSEKGRPMRGTVAGGRPPSKGISGWIEFADEKEEVHETGADPRGGADGAGGPGGAGASGGPGGAGASGGPGGGNGASGGRIGGDGSRGRRSPRSMFRPVTEGSPIAIIYPASGGEDGMNVRGEVIPAPEVERPLLVAGPGVREEYPVYLAEISGHLSVDGERISVEPVIRFEGNLTRVMGPVEFEGSVVIDGSIEDGAVVRASGEVAVAGNVAASVIEAGGPVRIGNGFIGGFKGRIRTEGGFEARFVEGGTVSAGGNVHVTEHILHSRILTDGSLLLDGARGLFAGGEAVVRGDVMVRHLGSPANARTMVAVGESPFLEERIREIERRFAGMENELSRTVRIERILRSRCPDLSRLDPGRARLFARLIRTRVALRVKLKEIGLERIALLSRRTEVEPGEVRVEETLQPGTEISIGGIRARFASLLAGVVIRLDEETGEVGIAGIAD